MATYFDRREGREKPIPDCSRVGLVWDEETQRCERKGLLDRMRMSIPQQGADLFDCSQYEEQEGNGLGFLPGAVAAGSAAGPIGTVVGVVVGVVGTLFSKLFGGGDDQATNYRPPSDSAQRFVQFSDQYGNEYVSYDMSPASLAEAARRGNRADDVYSYYSAFISNSTNAGASSAARRVIEDAATKNGISASRAADWILNTAGVTRIVQSFLPSHQGGATTTTHLPPACYGPTYHPFPIGHPQQDLCVPYPSAGQGGGGGGQPGQQPGQQGGSQSGQQQAWPGGAVGAAAGAALKYWLNPKTGRMEPIPACPQGSVFDQRIGQCVRANAQGEPDGEEDNWWLWLLLAGGAIVLMSGGNDRPSGGGRSKR